MSFAVLTLRRQMAIISRDCLIVGCVVTFRNTAGVTNRPGGHGLCGSGRVARRCSSPGVTRQKLFVRMQRSAMQPNYVRAAAEPT